MLLESRKTLHGNLDAKRDWGMPRITSGQCGWCCNNQSRMITWLPLGKHTRYESSWACFWLCQSQLAGLYRVWWALSQAIWGRIVNGDPTKSRQKLGWSPSVTFEQLVALMVEAESRLESARSNPELQQGTGDSEIATILKGCRRLPILKGFVVGFLHHRQLPYPLKISRYWAFILQAPCVYVPKLMV